MLVIRAEADAARDVFHREGRALWAQALPLVLEKHGYLGVALAGPEALERPDVWRRHGCVVVARLPPEAWNEDVATRMAESGVPVLVEGPAPEPLRRVLGVRHAAPAGGELTMVAADAELIGLARRISPGVGGRIRPATFKPVPRDRGMDWQDLRDVPVDATQAAAWSAQGWDLEEWSELEPDARVLASWFRSPGGPRFPAVVSRAGIIGCSVGLMTYLGQLHTSPPAPPGTRANSPSGLGLEAVLMGLVDLLHRRAGVVRPRVRPWPHPARWVLNVRHDVDRPPTTAAVTSVLGAHDRLGTAATWYWRARHIERRRRFLRPWRASAGGRAALRAVAARDRHEVAHHSDMLWRGAEREQRLIEDAIGRRVLGTSAHGDPTCFRFQGAPNVLWAEQQRMLYTELLQHAHVHPHRFAALASDGDVRPLEVICLPHHRSFDRSTTQGDTFTEQIVELPPRFEAAGGLLQVMNHPDLHPELLFRALATFPRGERLDWTAAEAAGWWRRTHVLENLRLEMPDGRLRVHAAEGVRDLAVELLAPDGTETVELVDVGGSGRARTAVSA